MQLWSYYLWTSNVYVRASQLRLCLSSRESYGWVIGHFDHMFFENLLILSYKSEMMMIFLNYFSGVNRLRRSSLQQFDGNQQICTNKALCLESEWHYSWIGVWTSCRIHLSLAMFIRTMKKSKQLFERIFHRNNMVKKPKEEGTLSISILKNRNTNFFHIFIERIILGSGSVEIMQICSRIQSNIQYTKQST